MEKWILNLFFKGQNLEVSRLNLISLIKSNDVMT